MAAEATKRDLDTRERTIELTVASIEKQFGKGAIMRLGAEGKLGKDIPIISTGSLGLDIALGTGGMPRGRIAEVFGPESSGKTTLALHVIAEAQRAGGICAFIDAEHALDVQYARKLGVRTDDLLISQPDFGEQALEIADMLVRSAAISVIVVDSVAALTPRAELEGEMGDAHVGLQARLMSQALRKLTATIHRSETMLLFINQIRMKIGVMFGSPETTTGGNALKFYSSVRLDIRRIGAIKQGEVVVGNRTRVKVVKNKLAPPFRQVEFDIIYGEGISTVGDLVDLGAEEGVLEKSGAWYAYAGERIGQGRENAKQYLKDHPELAAQLREALMRKAGLLTDATAAAEAPKSEVPKGDASKGDSAKSEVVAKGVGLKGAAGGVAASAAALVAPAPIVAASATAGSGNGSGKSAPRVSK
jgi:recombination protein RecA